MHEGWRPCGGAGFCGCGLDPVRAHNTEVAVKRGRRKSEGSMYIQMSTAWQESITELTLYHLYQYICIPQPLTGYGPGRSERCELHPMLLQYLTRSALSRYFVTCRITSYTCIQTSLFLPFSLRQDNTHKTSSFHQTSIIILTMTVSVKPSERRCWLAEMIGFYFNTYLCIVS